MDKEELKKTWQKFAENDDDIILNPDEKRVDEVAKGILTNEKKYGLKLCPCQVRDGSRKRDLEIICPCGFKTQEVWKKQKRCWCNLFIKK